MRVLLVSSSFGDYGGIQSSMFGLAEDLCTEGIEASICLKLVKGAAPSDALKQMIRATDLEVSIVPRGSRVLLRGIAASDVVHAHTPSPDVALLAKLTSTPLVLTVHNNRGQLPVRGRLLAKGALRLAARRLYVSDFVWVSWEGRDRRAGSSRIPMISRLPGGPLPVAARRGFVFVGRFVPNKGVDTLIEAYSGAGLDPDTWPLTLVGDGPLRKTAEEKVRRLDLRGVRFTGFVGQQERDEAIRRARWLVAAPCTNEDLGLTPIEARSAGVPAIVSRDGGLPEAVGSEGLICEPRDLQGLSALLRRAAEMPEDEYERRGKETREELLRWLPAASDYIKVFASVIQRRP